VQELLGNASHHSQAALIKVQIDLGNDLIRVNVEDNGKGFDPEILKDSTSLGLKLIRERAEMLGGNFEIDSAAGSGARISFTVPSKM
jgi:signal transduction histidine kinase